MTLPRCPRDGEWGGRLRSDAAGDLSCYACGYVRYLTIEESLGNAAADAARRDHAGRVRRDRPIPQSMRHDRRGEIQRELRAG